MNQYYHTEISEEFLLNEEESSHLLRVMRAAPGTQIRVSDGLGTIAICELMGKSGRKAKLKTLEMECLSEALPKLTLVFAPVKSSERNEWLLEKATEIGVNDIYPVLCQRSERKTLNMERSQKLLISAMKQSQNAWLPRLHPMQKLETFLKSFEGTKKAIAHVTEEAQEFHSFLKKPTELDYTVLIGPEGDFTPEEFDLAVQNNFHPVTLGPNRLRTETAAIYAIVGLNLYLR
jgi:16S rRNA (uracil1498-N3)-methyltransferase